MTTMNNVTIIPFNKLTLWKGNVRKTGIEVGLDELTASIAAHGLLNPLTVRPAGKGKYAVIAGQRRFLALQRLVQAGAFAKTTPLACTFAAEDANPAELSLAENVVRVAMHPADQFDAWRELIEKGASPAGIAERFGVPESTVRQRLALGRVSPRIFGLYRTGTISLEMLMAFTVTDDHALQEAVWDGAADWQRHDPKAIRRALTQADIPTHDKRMRFVTLSAYEAAGGTVRRDLFDPEGGGFVQDAALLDRLTREKLEGIAAQVKAEGWHWTETHTEFGWEERHAFEQAEPTETDLSEDQQHEADRLQEEMDGLEPNADAERIAAIEGRLAEIDACRFAWDEAVKIRAGAVVYLAFGGAVEIERGLIRAEDAQAVQQADDTGEEADEGAETAAEAEASPALSASLIEDLTAQKTAALRIETARNPDVALALTVHALATSVFYHSGGSALKAFVSPRNLRSSIRLFSTCPAVQALSDERDRIGDILPGQQADLWDWCLKAHREILLDVLAVAVAHGIDAVQGKAEANLAGRGHGEALGQALKLDMRNWYRPTAEGYFGRIGKAQILIDLEAARGAPGAPVWAKLKKADLADLAERETAERGWLPSPLQ